MTAPSPMGDSTKASILRAADRLFAEHGRVELGLPADDVALEVADALLPAPLPSELRAFLTVCDGARVGDVEVFDTERIIETTNHGAHSWHLPASTLVIGTAGHGRALIMTGGQDEVYEVDGDPWDARTIRLTADTPLDLFVRHGGTPLQDRAPWSTVPGLDEALEAIRTSLASDVDALLDSGIASRIGEPLPSSLHDFRQVDVRAGIRLLDSDEYHMFLINYRPASPTAGSLAEHEWEQACDALVAADLRDRIRAAPVAAVIEAVSSSDDGGELSMTDTVRSLAWLSLLGKARDELALLVEGEGQHRATPLRELARVMLAGHLPVSPDAVI